MASAPQVFKNYAIYAPGSNTKWHIYDEYKNGYLKGICIDSDNSTSWILGDFYTFSPSRIGNDYKVIKTFIE